MFIEDGILNIPKILQHFIASQKYIYDCLKDETKEEAEKRAEKFLESEGRERFLTYLSPIINGVGTYSIEEVYMPPPKGSPSIIRITTKI